jgi:hypothetical protein
VAATATAGSEADGWLGMYFSTAFTSASMDSIEKAYHRRSRVPVVQLN